MTSASGWETARQRVQFSAARLSKPTKSPSYPRTGGKIRSPRDEGAGGVSGRSTIAVTPLETQIERAYLLALNRRPTPQEKKRLGEFARKHGMANLCRLIFNTSEFMFVD